MLTFLHRLFMQEKQYKLYYFGGKKSKNAGDIFNVDLVKYFGINFVRSKKIQNADLICVGSNLDKLSVPSKRKLLIIGAGFILPPNENDCINREVEVLALRGQLSKIRMENLIKKSLDNCVLADPGLLISKIYPQNISKKYKLGIIPHYVDKADYDKISISLKNSDYKLIDIQQEAKDVAKEICECGCILSSSMHGLIFADSYNIPNRQLVMSDKLVGGNFKFKDYYSAFDLECPQPFDTRTISIDDELVGNIIDSYIPKSINAKQSELIKVFESIVVNHTV